MTLRLSHNTQSPGRHVWRYSYLRWVAWRRNKPSAPNLFFCIAAKGNCQTCIDPLTGHIAHWPNATVFVNTHKCEFVEPPVATMHVIRSKGTLFEAVLGEVELKIKVAKAPLEEELQGIAIISGGVWH